MNWRSIPSYVKVDAVLVPSLLELDNLDKPTVQEGVTPISEEYGFAAPSLTAGESTRVNVTTLSLSSNSVPSELTELSLVVRLKAEGSRTSLMTISGSM